MSETGHLGSNLGVIAVATALAATPLTVFAVDAWVPWAVLFTFFAVWVTGALALSDGASRRFLAGTLRKSTYTQIYTTRTRRLVARIWDAVCDPVADRAPVFGLFWGALSWRLYDKALLIAVVYPILLPVGQWVVTGEAARIGTPDSRIKADRPVLDATVAALAETGHGLIAFPRGLNAAEQTAARADVPAATLFRQLDDEGQRATVITRFLTRAGFAAVSEGSVIVAGRTRPDTVTALFSWALGSRSEAVATAPLSAVLLRGSAP